MKNKSSRRDFIKKAAGTALTAAAFPAIAAKSNKKVVVLNQQREVKKYGPNDQVNVAVIGCGIMGFNNAETTLQVPGVKVVGACDLYSGRLDHAKEVWGKDLFTTKNYQEILDRKDVDAVIHSNVGSLARSHLHRCHEQRQTRVLRKADGSQS
ncbi:MAG: Gfo/Idh/MocA family oxidoreductase [Bacteroidota bacterium]